MPSKNGGNFVKGVKTGEVLIYTLNKTCPPPLFTGHKVNPSGIGIEATVSISRPADKVRVANCSLGGWMHNMTALGQDISVVVKVIIKQH